MNFLLSLDEAQEAEVVQVLGAILELRENQAVQTPSIMCSIYFTTAMMHLVLNNFEKVNLVVVYLLLNLQANQNIFFSLTGT